MSSRKRRAAAPRRVDDRDLGKEFAFVHVGLSQREADGAFRTHGDAQHDEEQREVAAGEREQLDDTRLAAGVNGEAERATKKPRLSTEEEEEDTQQSVFYCFLTLPITLSPPPCELMRVAPLLSSTPHAPVSMSDPVLPIGRLTVSLESKTAVEAFFSVSRSNPAVKSSLIWLQTGNQLLKLETSTEQVFLPVTVHPALDYCTAVGALCGLGRARHAALVLSSRAQEDEDETDRLCGFEAKVWVTEKLLECENPSELPRRGLAIVENSKALVRGLYPGLDMAEPVAESVAMGPQGNPM